MEIKDPHSFPHFLLVSHSVLFGGYSQLCTQGSYTQNQELNWFSCIKDMCFNPCMWSFRSSKML